MIRAVHLVALVLTCAARLATAQTPLDSIVPPSPVPNGFIVDRGAVLAPDATTRLNARIGDVQRTTGGDVGVAILRDLGGRAPADVGVAIYRAWKIGHVDAIGSARRDLGALLLIVPKELAPDRRGHCWITTGRGAEGTLIDTRAADVCRDSVTPRLKARDYAAAVEGGVNGIAAAFAQAVASAPPDTGVPAARPPRVGVRPPIEDHGSSPLPWIVGGVLGAAGLAGGAVAMRRRRRDRPRLCPRGHGPMVRLSEAADDAELSPGQRTEERLGSVDYDVWACTRCPERVVIPYRRWSHFDDCPTCGFKTVAKEHETIAAATMLSTGLEEITLTCANCGWRDVRRHVLPIIPPPSTSSSSSDGGSSWSSGGGGSSDGGSSFGGSGETAGGGGGDSY